MSNTSSNPFDVTETYGTGGSYLKPADLGNQRHDVTISEVTLEPNYDKTGQVIVLSFVGREKKLTLNKTRSQAIMTIAEGERDARKWVGLTISLEPGMTKKLDGTPTPTIVVSLIKPPQVPFTPQTPVSQIPQYPTQPLNPPMAVDPNEVPF